MNAPFLRRSLQAAAIRHPRPALSLVILFIFCACDPPRETGGRAHSIASTPEPDRSSPRVTSSDRASPVNRRADQSAPPVSSRDGAVDRAEADRAAPSLCEEETGSEIYARRIAPLLDESRPDSCGGCHLQGIDLASFMRGSPCTSMACLIEQRLVNFADPEESEILRLINRGRSAEADERTQGAAELEYQGFLDWIQFSARCHHEACGLIRDPCAPISEGLDSALPARDQSLDQAQVIEDFGEIVDRRPPLERRPLASCAEPDLLRFFESRFWRWKGRCYHCHRGDGVELGIGDAPTWFGDEVDEAEAISVTYRRIIDRGYLNTGSPAESLLILKPLAIGLGGVMHGGGTKLFRREEDAYRDFLDFASAYARCLSPLDQGPPEHGPPEHGPPEQGPPEQGPPEQGPPEQGPSEQGPSEQGPPEQGVIRD